MNVWQRYTLADLETGDPATVARIQRINSWHIAAESFRRLAKSLSHVFEDKR